MTVRAIKANKGVQFGRRRDEVSAPWRRTLRIDMTILAGILLLIWGLDLCGCWPK